MTMSDITLTFTAAQLAALNDAVVLLPYYRAQPLIAHINAQLQRAHEAAADAGERVSGATSPPDMAAGS